MNQYNKYFDHPILSKDEQKELIIAHRKNGDLKARERLIIHQIRFVHSIAQEYKFDRSHFDDLIQEGMKGLLVASDKFDLNKIDEVAFNTYAGWWIRAYILKYITDNFRMVKMNTTNNKRKIFWNLSKESRKLEVQGIVPDSQQLADSMGVKKEEVEEIAMRMATHPISIDVSSEESRNWIDSILPSSPAPDKEYNSLDAYRKLQTDLDEFRARLNTFHLDILEKRILTNELTLAAIGEKWGRCRERVRQIENQIRYKLIKFMQGRSAQYVD